MREQLQYLDSIVNLNLEILSQITIDLVEETLCDFEDEDYNIDAQIYKINNVLEIANPSRILDVGILRKLVDILSNKK